MPEDESQSLLTKPRAGSSARAGAYSVARPAGTTLLLAWVAGYVDVVCYVMLFHIFVTHMTGNTAATALHVAQMDWKDALARGSAIPMFALGVIAGAALLEVRVRRGARSAYAPGFIVETLLLAAFIVAVGRRAGQPIHPDTGGFFLLLALPTLAMGVQNATFRKVGAATVRTTYITGMLTNFCEELVDYCFWAAGGCGAACRRDKTVFLGTRRPSMRRIALLGGIWVTFLVGSACGILSKAHFGPACLWLPVGCLVVLAAADSVLPLGGGMETAERRRLHRLRSGE